MIAQKYRYKPITEEEMPGYSLNTDILPCMGIRSTQMTAIMQQHPSLRKMIRISHEGKSGLERVIPCYFVDKFIECVQSTSEYKFYMAKNQDGVFTNHVRHSHR